MDAAEPRVGLCATCKFHRIVAGARSSFHLCERSFTDPRFPRYPPLPVAVCAGYLQQDDPAADPGKTQ
jgi:hypothetical protein